MAIERPDISNVIRNLFKSDELLTGTIHGVKYERENRTERDVEIPPAFMITDETGAMWSFGQHYREYGGWYEFNVIRNDVDTDEYASKIVYRGGRVWIFGRDGWRVWSGTTFI